MHIENAAVSEIVSNCSSELQRIAGLVQITSGAELSEYVKKYAVIRATGCIEFSFKKIIADKVDENSHSLAVNFIKNKVRLASYNPNFKNITDVLRSFDQRWLSKFQELISFENKASVIESLRQLCQWRNSFAHGGHPDIDIAVVINHFNVSLKVIEVLDRTVNSELIDDGIVEDSEDDV